MTVSLGNILNTPHIRQVHHEAVTATNACVASVYGTNLASTPPAPKTVSLVGSGDILWEATMRLRIAFPAVHRY